MASAKFRAVIAPQARTLNVIWGLFLAAPFVYVAVAWVLTRTPQPLAGETTPLALIQALFVLVAAGALVASYVVPGRMLADERLKSLLRGPFRQEPPAGAAELEPVEQRLVMIFPQYQTAMITSFALRESIAVLGLVLTVLTGSFVMVVPWAVVAVALVTSRPPKPAEFLDRALPLARAAG